MEKKDTHLIKEKVLRLIQLHFLFFTAVITIVLVYTLIKSSVDSVRLDIGLGAILTLVLLCYFKALFDVHTNKSC